MEAKFLAILLFLLYSIKSFSSSEILKPQLKVHTSPNNTFERLNISNTKRFYRLGRNVSNLYYVYCFADFPVRWNYTGYISAKQLKFTDTKDDPKSSKFRLIRQFSDAETNEYSIRLACESIEQPLLYDEIFIFNWNGATKTLIQPRKRNIINSKIIPCPTLNPVEKVTLVITTETGEQQSVSDIDKTLKYVPTEGFVSESIFHGNYTCIQSSSLVTISAVFTALQEFNYFPTTSEIKQFDEEVLRLKCSSHSGNPLYFVISNLEEAPFSIFMQEKEKIPLNVQALNISYQNDTNSIEAIIFTEVSRKAQRYTGEVKCFANISGTNIPTLIHLWNFDILYTPALRLNNLDRKIECSSTSDVVLDILYCEENEECNFYNIHKPRNMVNPTTVKGRNCIWSDEAISCLKYSHSSGIAKCEIEGLYKEWNILETLDQRKYLSWMDAPTRELLRIDEISDILYTNLTTEFTCEALRYIFPKYPHFEIGFQNNSFVDIDSTRFVENITYIMDNKTYSRSVMKFNSIIIVRMNLPIDAVSIKCVATWWNTTEKFSVLRKFQTKHLIYPKFTNLEDTNINESSVNFIVGESNRRLMCVVDGEPKPDIKWFFNGTNALERFPDLKISAGVAGENHLEFPEILKTDIHKFTGEYLCVANNSLGSAERKTFLHISDAPEKPAPETKTDDLSEVYISTAVIGGVLLLALFISLMVFRRRYKRTKSMLRNLTEKEVVDFFEGNPNLAGNGANVEVVDFLPYDRSYEIPLNDLYFKFTDNNILGSGEFAFVVRGLIVSCGKPVAIKVSKPSTDVTLFKSLLSEVKIMSYIGQQENVTSLIGVCTEEIRCRLIYIATDICELGSLKTFLHECRPNFVSLINANQELDVSLIPRETNASDYVTTLDLISFAAQVAKGMEYLAYKSVIHADLATRNVLLTAERRAKISDFGLSKRLYESTDYVKKSRTPLPWRWMALESLETLTFSTKSDVWAYGVTLYEIFTIGNAPFPNEHWSHDFVARLKDGMRMGRPEFSTHEIYSKITTCWENTPEHRPDFGTLRSFFESLHEKYSMPLPDRRAIPSSEHNTTLNSDTRNYQNILSTQGHYTNSDAEKEMIEMQTC